MLLASCLIYARALLEYVNLELYIVFKTSGSIKERTQTSTEMGAGCQRNRLVMGVGRGEEVCR